MHRSARDSAATRTLLEHVEERATGKLAVGAGAVEVAVYLLNGSIMSATAGDDDRQLVRMLAIRDLLGDEAADRFELQVENGEPIFGSLLEEVPAPGLDDVLRERFVQNLCEFLTSASSPVFYEQKGVFVDNIQMGFETDELLDEVADLCDQAHRLDLDTLLVRGDGSPPAGDTLAAAIADELDPATPRTVSSLLHELPLEPMRARALLVDLLDGGVAARPGSGDDDLSLDEPVPIVEPGVELAPAPEGPEAVVTIEAESEPTEAVEGPPSDPLESIDDLDVVVVEDLDEEPPVTVEDDAAEEPTLDGTAPLDLEDIEDEPTQQVDRDQLAAQDDAATDSTAGGSGDEDDGNGADLSWMTSVAEDELDFFSDHDYERGGGDEGTFSTEQHNLDKVEVATLPDDEPEVLEADEAPQVRYGAPVLSEEEAIGKLEVANGVLAAVVKAFDEAEGTGRGRAVVQLLVDGGPSRYAPLLQNIRVSETGELPDAMLLRNLYSRPATEHRQLLNSSLVDIIERALSSAADELPDEAFDSVLEHVAGYRQRLGL